jgi:hypothetical protein
MILGTAPQFALIAAALIATTGVIGADSTSVFDGRKPPQNPRQH